MKLTVYQLEFSPYCIPITAALDALAVSYKTVEVTYRSRSKIIQVTDGAYFQVPTLLHGTRAIYESSPDSIDVARYIDQEFAGGRLFPDACEGLQRILVSYIENEVELATFKLQDPHRIADIADIVERTESVRFKERRFGRGCLEKWKRGAPALKRKAWNLLEAFELMLEYSPFLLGDAPVYTDYALLGILKNLTYGGYTSLPKRFNRLQPWQARLTAYRY